MTTRLLTLLWALQTIGCRGDEAEVAMRPDPARVGEAQPPSRPEPRTPPPAPVRRNAEPPVAPPSPGSPVELLAVRWTKAIKLRALSEVDAAIADESQEIGQLPSERGRTAIKSCLEALRLHAAGFRAERWDDADPYAGRCRPLSLLKSARPSRRSFVADIRRVDAATVRALPAAFHTAFSDEEVERQARAGQRGRGWRALAPRLRLERDPVLPDFEGRVLDGDGGDALVQLMAWGDFDGDGTEDLMVHVVNGAVGGTAWYERLFVLTRTRPRAVLTVLSVEDGQSH